MSPFNPCQSCDCYSGRVLTQCRDGVLRAVPFIDSRFHANPGGESSRKNLRELGEGVEAFVLPKGTLASFGPEWTEVLNRVAEDPAAYMSEYSQRDRCESYDAADTERSGRQPRQRREDRREMASVGTTVLHNPLSVRVGAG